MACVFGKGLSTNLLVSQDAKLPPWVLRRQAEGGCPSSVSTHFGGAQIGVSFTHTILLLWESLSRLRDLLGLRAKREDTQGQGYPMFLN